MLQHLQSDDSKTAGLKASFLIIALTASSLFFVLSSTNSVESMFTFRENWIYTSSFAMLSCLLAFTTLVSMIASSSHPERSRVYANSFFCSSLSLLLALAELIFLYANIDPNLFYFFNLIISTALVYNITQILLILLKISGDWSTYISIAHSALAFFLNIKIDEDLRYGGINEALLVLGIQSHALIAATPITVFLLTYFVTNFRLEPTHVIGSIISRFNFNQRENSFTFSFFTILAVEILLTLGGLVLLLVFYDDSILPQQANLHLPLSQLYLAWIPTFALTLHYMRKDYNENRKNISIATLVSSQAKRFLLRYHQNNRLWSTTVGLQTATFIVDHDPDKSIEAAFPSYISQFRQNQIEVIKKIALDDLLLNESVLGSQMYGSIDSEISKRPCVDTLLTLTTLQLDGIAAIEKRLKMFASLFPIIDPDLATRITSKSIEQHLSRNYWFLFLDYAWIDQSISQRQNTHQYQVSMFDVYMKNRLGIIEILKQHKTEGHLIWLSARAKNRLLMEAPYLSAIIKKWESPKINQNIEIDMFTISFEDLIPRLQKYYNLDLYRDRLRYYEPSQESQRITRVIHSEMKNILGTKGVIQILGTISNFAWQGFYEKDLALGLVLEVYEIYMTFSHDDTEGIIKNKFIETVENIGYPCQDLFSAHQIKMQIREVDNINAICTRTKHPRFTEAWSLLSTINTKERYSNESLIRLMNILEKVFSQPQAIKAKIVIDKAAIAWLNIAQSLQFSKSELELTERILNKMIKFYVTQPNPADNLALLIDGRVYLKEEKNIHINLSYESIDLLSQYINRLRSTKSNNLTELTTIKPRWDLIQSEYKDYLSPTYRNTKAS